MNNPIIIKYLDEKCGGLAQFHVNDVCLKSVDGALIEVIDVEVTNENQSGLEYRLFDNPVAEAQILESIRTNPRK